MIALRILLISLSLGILAAADPAPSPAAAPQTETPTVPHLMTDIQLVTLNTSGSLDEASRKHLDQLSIEGWKMGQMVAISTTPPITMAIMVSKMWVPSPRPPAVRTPAVLPPQTEPQPMPVPPMPTRTFPPTPLPAPAPAHEP